MFKFLFSRYIAYAIIALEVLLAPIYLSKSVYIEYEYIKNLINLSSFVLLGSHTGFLYYYYAQKQNYFPELFKVSIFILFFSSLLFSLFCQSLFLVLPFYCYGISVFIEKKLQIEKKFYIAILYKPFVALMLIVTVIGSFFILNNKTNIFLILSTSYFLALILWFFIIRLLAKNVFNEILSVRKNITKNDFANFFKLIKIGIVENAATVILMFYLFIDRYMLNSFYKDQLASYSLAFNFSQFVFIGINSLSYIQNVELGENLNILNREQIFNILRKALSFFFILFLCVLCISIIYVKMFSDFENLIIYTILLSFFIGFFYACNVLSIIPLFKGKQKVIAILLLLFFLINITSSFLFFQLSVPPVWNVGKSVILLSFVGIYIVNYSIKLVDP